MSKVPLTGMLSAVEIPFENSSEWSIYPAWTRLLAAGFCRRVLTAAACSDWGILSIVPRTVLYVTRIHLPLSDLVFPWLFFAFFLLGASSSSPQQRLQQGFSSCPLSPQVNPDLCFHFSLPLQDSLSELQKRPSAEVHPTGLQAPRMPPEWDANRDRRPSKVHMQQADIQRGKTGPRSRQLQAAGRRVW